jgi:hypothetical protein
MSLYAFIHQFLYNGTHLEEQYKLKIQSVSKCKSGLLPKAGNNLQKAGWCATLQNPAAHQGVCQCPLPDPDLEHPYSEVAHSFGYSQM